MLKKLCLSGCLAAALVLAACGSNNAGKNSSTANTSSTGAATTPASAARAAAAPAPVTAHIKLFDYQPNPLTVPAGTTVTWINEDAIEHSVTSGTPPTPDGAFDSGFFTQGQSWSFTFQQKGDFHFFCMRHNFMTGEIIVQ